MQKSTKQEKPIPDKKSLFEFFTEIMGWLQIVASPLLVGLLIAAIIYFSNPNGLTFTIAVIVATIGLIVGVIWATKVWKRKGTMHFMSRVMTTPELDEKKESKK